MADNTNEGPMAYAETFGTPEVLHDLRQSDAPTPEKFFSVAMGLATWTAVERKLIDSDPRLAGYEKRMRQVAQAALPAPDPVVWPSEKRGWELRLETAGVGLIGKAKVGDVIRLVNAEAKMVLRLFRAADQVPNVFSLHFAAGRPPGTIALYAGPNRIPLLREFDEDGYATAKADDLLPAVERKGVLEVRTE